MGGISATGRTSGWRETFCTREIDCAGAKTCASGKRCFHAAMPIVWNAFGATSARTAPCRARSSNASADARNGGLTTISPSAPRTASAVAKPGPKV